MWWMLTACIFGNVKAELAESYCAGTCEKLYEPDQCGVEPPGESVDDMIGFCKAECGAAYQISGEAGEYDPWTYTESVELENRAQVELWKECVTEISCDFLSESGYCAPIW